MRVAERLSWCLLMACASVAGQGCGSGGSSSGSASAVAASTSGATPVTTASTAASQPNPNAARIRAVRVTPSRVDVAFASAVTIEAELLDAQGAHIDAVAPRNVAFQVIAGTGQLGVAAVTTSGTVLVDYTAASQREVARVRATDTQSGSSFVAECEVESHPPIAPVPATLRPLDYGPWLERVTQTEITVSWKTVDPTSSRVVFGTAPGRWVWEVSSPAKTRVHHVRLTGLRPSTRYHYQVVSLNDAGEAFGRAPATFKTAPATAQEPVRFVFTAEVHDNAAVRGFADDVDVFDPHLILDAGDNISDVGDDGQWREYFQNGDELYDDAPLFLTLGNHNYDGWNPFQDRSSRTFEYVERNGNGHWYTFRVGCVQFVGLDSTYRSWVRNTTDQPGWLDRTLADATDGVDDPTFLVAWYHAPAWESDVHGIEVDQRLWEESFFIPKFERYDVDLVLWGHGKIYERCEKAGRTYIQVCTGASLRPFSINAPNSVFRYNQDRTALLVDVDPARPEMRWRAILPSGATLEQGTIGP